MQRPNGVFAQLLGAGARACAGGATRSNAAPVGEHALAGGLITRGVASSNPLQEQHALADISHSSSEDSSSSRRQSFRRVETWSADAGSSVVGSGRTFVDRVLEARAALLKQAGLWVSLEAFKALPTQMQQQIATRQKAYWDLHRRSIPAANMSIMPVDGGLLLHVAPVSGSDLASGSSSSSSSSSDLEMPLPFREREDLLKQCGMWFEPDDLQRMPQHVQQAISSRARAFWQLHKHGVPAANMSVAPIGTALALHVAAAAAADPAASKRASASSSSSSRDRAFSTEAPAAGGDATTAAASQQDGAEGGGASSRRKQRQARRQQQLQQQQLEKEEERARARRQRQPLGPLTQRDLVPASRSQRVANLNSQLRQASADNQHKRVADLFEGFLQQGLAAAGAEQQQQGQAQEQGALPKDYKPDQESIQLYCKSLGWLAEQHLFESYRSGRGNVDRLSSSSSNSTGVRVQAQQADTVLALWGDRSLKAPGWLVYTAAMAVYRAEKRHEEVLELFAHIKSFSDEATVSRHYRLNLYATMAALSLPGRYREAASIARGFADRVIPFEVRDYKARIAFVYRQLAGAASAARDWDGAIYWLQQLINNESLVPVEPPTFLSVLAEACAAGKLDVARVMMSALDAQLAVRNQPPHIYDETRLCQVLAAAGKGGDTALIKTAWERLLTDASARQRQANPKAIAAAGDDGQQQQQQAWPSPKAYVSVARAYVNCSHWGEALEMLAQLQAAHPDAPAASVYGDLRFFPDSLHSEARLAAAFAALQARQKEGGLVTTAMMNVITRAIAKLGNTEATGKVFESYGSWGLAPDADSYNAVMESCEAAKKVAAVEGLMSYMASKGVAPNAASWNLLLSTAVRAEDCWAVGDVLSRMRAAGFAPSEWVLKRAWALASRLRDQGCRRAVEAAMRQQGVPWPREHRSGGNSGGSDDDGDWAGRGGRAQADTWTPTQQRRQKQQQQPPQQQEGGSSGGSGSGGSGSGGSGSGGSSSSSSSNGRGGGGSADSSSADISSFRDQLLASLRRTS